MTQTQHTPGPWTCTFAPAGTFGHECGKPASKIAVMPSTVKPGALFKTGRCNECAPIKGGENSTIISWESVGEQ